MAQNPFCKAHWQDIDPDRKAAYLDRFGWHAVTQRHFAPAEISPNRAIADTGCAPCNIAAEMPRQVGPSRHVHAFDVNVEFLEVTRKNARAMGIENWLTAHVSDGNALPASPAEQALLDSTYFVVSRQLAVTLRKPDTTGRAGTSKRNGQNGCRT